MDETIMDPRRVRAELEDIDVALRRIDRAGFTRRVPTGVGLALTAIRAGTDEALRALRIGAPEAFAYQRASEGEGTDA